MNKNEAQLQVIVDHINLRTLEKAKRLSVDKDFLSSVENLQKKWNIEPKAPSMEIFSTVFRVDHVLVFFAFGKKHTAEDWSQLLIDINTMIVEPNRLDPNSDFGLVVIGICFGLTRQNILERWDLLEMIATQGKYPWGDIKVEDPINELRRHTGKNWTILYLTYLLENTGFDLSKLDSSFKRWMTSSTESLKIGNIVIDHELIPIFLRILNNQLDQRGRNQDVSLRLKPGTTFRDIERMWPFVEAVMAETFEQTDKKTRIWDTFPRDSFIWEQKHLHRNTYEKAYEDYLKEHPEEEVVDLSSIIRNLSRHRKGEGQ